MSGTDDRAARHARVKALFDAALERSPNERGTWLAAQVDDPSLCAEVESLLAAHAGADTGFLEDAAPHAVATPAPTSDDYGFDRAFRIVRELGRGGMGIVFLAERADGAYDAEVALKLIAPGGELDPEAATRLRLERQILARLNHPNIARLYDGGTTANGAPYLVLEYVDGERLDRWTEARRPSIEQRLALFLKVCDAVEHAHRNLVVHRDLKPGNILVAKDGEPKLLDFGIAKVLAEGASDETATRLLTPRYAAPEQIRGEPVTTQTDVYALGVVLYELLTGTSPYGEATSRPHLLPRAICDEEPTRPSLSFSRTTAPTTAPRDANAQRHAARRLRGDLDAIVMKALRKRPGDRYGSAEALAADLRAHLAGLPVAARRGSRAYRARRFVARHRLALAAAATLAALTLAFIVGLARQLEATQRERDRGARVTDVLLGVFNEADPATARGKEPTMREVLDRGAARIERELAGEPELLARIAGELSGIYSALGDADRALALASRALDAAPPDGDPVAHARALHARGVAEFAKGEYSVAGRTFSEVARRAQGRDRRLEADALLRAAIATSQDGRYEEAWPRQRDLAEALLRDAGLARFDAAALVELATREPRLVDQVADNASAACETLTRLADYDAALERCDQAQALERALLAPDSPEHGETLNSITEIRAARGDRIGAIAAQRETLELYRRIYGDDHVKTALTRVNLAVDLKSTGQFDAARTELEQALPVFEAKLGTSHRAYLTALNNLGNIEMQVATIVEDEQGVEAGRAAYTRALDIHRRVHGLRVSALAPDDPDIAQSLMNIGNALKMLGDMEGAVAHQREALVRYERKPGPGHPATEQMRLSLAQKLVDFGEAEEALGMARHVGALMRERGERPEMVLAARWTEAKALYETGAHDEALALARKVVAEAREQGEDVAVSIEEIDAWIDAREPR